MINPANNKLFPRVFQRAKGLNKNKARRRRVNVAAQLQAETERASQVDVFRREERRCAERVDPVDRRRGARPTFPTMLEALLLEPGTTYADALLQRYSVHDVYQTPEETICVFLVLVFLIPGSCFVLLFHDPVFSCYCFLILMFSHAFSCSLDLMVPRSPGPAFSCSCFIIYFLCERSSCVRVGQKTI